MVGTAGQITAIDLEEDRSTGEREERRKEELPADDIMLGEIHTHFNFAN